MRVGAQFGATQGMVDLATMVKKQNLDAIHDTVHKMARDEARHGKTIKGLLKRYFPLNNRDTNDQRMQKGPRGLFFVKIIKKQQQSSRFAQDVFHPLLCRIICDVK